MSLPSYSEEEILADLCRKSFKAFIREFWECVPGAGKLIWNWHIDLIADELEVAADRVFKGLPREYDLVFNVPPGTSKSTEISILFPAWVWTRMLEGRFIASTHTNNLVLDLASKSRSVILSDKYKACYSNVVLDKEGEGYFTNTVGGDRRACTVGGKTPTGFHAHFLLVDDALDPQGARSEAEIETASKFMTEVLPSRKVDKETALTILIMQRLHYRDPTAVMIKVSKNEGSTPVRVICLPGVLTDKVSPPIEEIREKYPEAYVEDNLLDPIRLPRKVLRDLEIRLGAYGYACQILQDPIPPGGGMFKETYFNQRVKAAPFHAKRIRFWDRACLDASTLIETIGGAVSIDKVKGGDLVLTRQGWCKVKWAGITKEVKASELSMVSLFNGGHLVGTKEHLVWTESRGWTQLQDLKDADCRMLYGKNWPDRAPIFKSLDQIVPVYDIEVEDVHEFFANGILVHNSTQDGGCYTAGVLMSKDADGSFFVEDCVHGQWEPDQRNSVIRATALRDRARYGPKDDPDIYVEAEGGSSGRDAWKQLAKYLAGFRVFEDKPTGKKDVRAEPWSCQLAARNVYLVEDGRWDIEGYIEEHCLFKPDPSISRIRGKLADRVDSSCLIAGTMVETQKGLKAIEKIVAGEFVLTRNGYKEVLWSGCSGFVDRLIKVEFENGSILIGTENHLVWTQVMGYITLGSLLKEDKVISLPLLQERSSCRRRLGKIVRFVANGLKKIIMLFVVHQNVLPNGGLIKEGVVNTNMKSRYSKGLNIKGKYLTGGIFGEKVKVENQNHCIGLNGVIFMETSPKIMSFITLTETPLIIRFQTLLAFLIAGMVLFMQIVGGLKNNLVIWIRYVKRLLSGINQKKGDNGIKSMELRHLRAENQEPIPVHFVKKNLNRSVMDLGEQTGIVQHCVEIGMLIDLVKEGRNLPVSCVGKNSCEILQNVVQGNVGRQCGGNIPVYDLNVKDDHEFFANGILVHNSGAFNLLTGGRISSGIRILTRRLNSDSKLKQRIVVCSKEELEATIIDERAILLSICDPLKGGDVDGYPRFGGVDVSEGVLTSPTEPPLPPHALSKIIGSLVVSFADIQPAEYQDRWDEPVEEYGKLPVDLILKPEQGKKIWREVLKKRDDPWQVLVIQDNGDRRAVSMALGIAEMLRIPKEQGVYVVASPEVNLTKAPNMHVYETIKSSRAMVI